MLKDKMNWFPFLGYLWLSCQYQWKKACENSKCFLNLQILFIGQKVGVCVGLGQEDNSFYQNAKFSSCCSMVYFFQKSHSDWGKTVLWDSVWNCRYTEKQISAQLHLLRGNAQNDMSNLTRCELQYIQLHWLGRWPWPLSDELAWAVGEKDRSLQSSASETGLHFETRDSFILIIPLQKSEYHQKIRISPTPKLGAYKKEVLVWCIFLCWKHVEELTVTQWVWACVYIADTISLSALHDWDGLDHLNGITWSPMVLHVSNSKSTQWQKLDENAERIINHTMSLKSCREGENKD